MDIYKLLYTIIAFHLCLSCVAYIDDLNQTTQGGIYQEDEVNTLVTEMLVSINGTAQRAVTDSNGEKIHDLCDPDNANCNSDFQTDTQDTTVLDDIMRYVPGGKYVTKAARFVKFVALAPYELIIIEAPQVVRNAVVLAILWIFFAIWHFAIAVNIFNWFFNNRGKPSN